MSHILKNDGYIDALAAGEDVFIGGAVDDTSPEMIGSDNVVK